MRPTTPFSHIIEVLRQNAANKRDDEDDAPGDVGADDDTDDDRDDQEKRKKTKKKAKPEIDEEDNGDERREDGDAPDDDDKQKRARALAQKIIQAGEQRRAEAPPELPTNRTARLIILNGMRRRGELSDQEYEQLARTSR